MSAELFTRAAENPLLAPTTEWWEMGGTFNPGVAVVDGRVLLLYRAVGRDHLSRFGLAWSDDGRRCGPHQFCYEPAADDVAGRLGVEDPRLTWLEGDLWAVYTKVAVDPVGTPPGWQLAPYRGQVAMARLETGLETDAAVRLHDERTVLEGAKDGVLFPRRIGGRYYALVRYYPALQIISSPDLHTWSAPRPLLDPRPGTWEAERVGAGPPPIEAPWGWLVLYHANAEFDWEHNRRHYYVGLALLENEAPERIRYRHPHPIFEPRERYETEGQVPNTVFPSGLIERDAHYYLYYGAGDCTVCLATVPTATMAAFLQDVSRTDGAAIAPPT